MITDLLIERCTRPFYRGRLSSLIDKALRVNCGLACETKALCGAPPIKTIFQLTRINGRKRPSYARLALGNICRPSMVTVSIAAAPGAESGGSRGVLDEAKRQKKRLSYTSTYKHITKIVNPSLSVSLCIFVFPMVFLIIAVYSNILKFAVAHDVKYISSFSEDKESLVTNR